MKVLFLTNIPSPYRVRFFNELGKLCDLTVLYERETASDRDNSWLPTNDNAFEEVFLKGIKVSRGFAFNPGIIKYLKNHHHDVIVIGGYSSPTGMLAIEYCKLHKIPFILNADGGLIREESALQHKVKKHFISSAEVWLSTGKDTSDYLMHYGARVDGIRKYPLTSIGKSDILKQPVTKNEKAAFREKLGMQNKPTAISVGSFIPRKGFDILIDSWANVNPDYNLLIIGGGPEKDNLNKQIEELKLKNVTLLDFVTTEKLMDYYKACDLFVMPTREDIWGLVINEAMANGLPIITSDKCVAGVELVKNNINGYVVPLEEPETLARKINEILSNDDLANAMSAENLGKINHYTFEDMAKRHIEIFNNMITPYYIYY